VQNHFVDRKTKGETAMGKSADAFQEQFENSVEGAVELEKLNALGVTDSRQAFLNNCLVRFHLEAELERLEAIEQTWTREEDVDYSILDVKWNLEDMLFGAK